jgi:hypothetical protein
MREKYLNMKKIEKDYEYLETSPEMLAKGLRRISRPKFLDKPKDKTQANKTLTKSIEVEKTQFANLKEDLLNDTQFLERLKDALAI